MSAIGKFAFKHQIAGLIILIISLEGLVYVQPPTTLSNVALFAGSFIVYFLAYLAIMKLFFSRKAT